MRANAIYPEKLEERFRGTHQFMQVPKLGGIIKSEWEWPHLTYSCQVAKASLDRRNTELSYWNESDMRPCGSK